MSDEGQQRVGSVVDDRYKILEVMAAGSMGAVYKGERVPVGKIVAIKFLHASYANDSEFQARFDRETRVMSKLAHPNCVSVVDFGVWGGEPYLVMDFVAGVTLRTRMDRGPITPGQALSIARQIASGLAHAHEQGIVHRDVKPANIMITEEIGHGERVRILDFGLARLRGNVGRDATQTNMVVGTPNYMAPEQTVPGATIDARTDIYALGVVLFEMVVGERPFQAEDTLQLLGMHRAAPIPRLADRVKEGVEIPSGLQDLIDRAMAKKPEERFQSAIDMAEALDEVIAGKRPSLDATVPDTKKSSRNKKITTDAIAPTELRINTADIEEASSYVTPAPKRSFWRGLLVAMLLVGGAAAMAGYLIKRNQANPAKAPTEGSAGSAGSAIAMIADAAEQGSAIAPADAVQVAAVEPADALDIGSAGSAAVEIADAADLPPPIDAGEAPPVPEDAGGSASATNEEEGIAIDPTAAEDLDPSKGSAAQAEDEDENAPKTPEEVEKKEPAKPPAQLATNLHDAVGLIKAGQRDLALASLRALRKKSPKSAYIPFLIGNLYYDKRWWSVAMDDYADAIKKNAAYRNNPTLNLNVIRMLASSKTRQRATNFLRGTIGHPAGAYLRWAAAHDPNPVVRKQAQGLARYIR